MGAILLRFKSHMFFLLSTSVSRSFSDIGKHQERRGCARQRAQSRKPNTGNKICYSDSSAICYIPVHRKVATTLTSYRQSKGCDLYRVWVK